MHSNVTNPNSPLTAINALLSRMGPLASSLPSQPPYQNPTIAFLSLVPGRDHRCRTVTAIPLLHSCRPLYSNPTRLASVGVEQSSNCACPIPVPIHYIRSKYNHSTQLVLLPARASSLYNGYRLWRRQRRLSLSSDSSSVGNLLLWRS